MLQTDLAQSPEIAFAYFCNTVAQRSKKPQTPPHTSERNSCVFCHINTHASWMDFNTDAATTSVSLYSVNDFKWPLKQLLMWLKHKCKSISLNSSNSKYLIRQVTNDM